MGTSRVFEWIIFEWRIFEQICSNGLVSEYYYVRMLYIPFWTQLREYEYGS